jgi:glycosyltransferase involved in cell wall biosynthesis
VSVGNRTRPLRVRVITPFGTSATTGGAEKWLLTLLGATRDLAAQVEVLQEGPFAQELRDAGIPADVWATGPRVRDIAVTTLRLARRLRSDRPDVLLGNGVKAQLVAAGAGLLTGVPTVWAKHDHSFDRRLAVPLGRLSDRVVAAVEELGEPVQRPDVVVVPPPASPEQPASRDEARRHLAALGLTWDERPTLVMAGRLVPYKGVDDAVTALAHPGAEAWRLVVIGADDHSSPGETDRLQRLAGALGVADRVTWLAPVDRLSHWLAAFDALAVLTKPAGRRTPGKEGFGTVAFEAMVAGVPVVAGTPGATSRRLENRAGITVPSASPEGVAAALGRLTSPQTRAEMGAAAREIVRDHPGPEECADRLVATLRDAARTRVDRPEAAVQPSAS